MKTFLKWLGIVVTAVVCLVMLGAAWAYAASNRQINKRYSPGVTWLNIPHDSVAIARGRHIVTAIAKCTDCHGEDLGGTQMIDDNAFGHFAAPNITTGHGGRGTIYTDEDLIRVVQHGVKRDGHAALIMPSEAYIHMSDDDLAAVIAYVRSVPPVDKVWPPQAYGPVARGLIAAGKLPVFAAARIDHERRDVRPRPAIDTTAEYGRYLSLIGGCQGCHNPALSGGPIEGGDPSSPPAANLTPTGFDHYTEADFVRALREGKALGGRQLSDYMPWKASGRMTDDEIRAVYNFLKTLPPKEMGQR